MYCKDIMILEIRIEIKFMLTYYAQTDIIS